MDVKQILEDALINKSRLAKRLWPENEAARIQFYQKLKGINGRNLGKHDKMKLKIEAERIIEVLKKLCE